MRGVKLANHWKFPGAQDVSTFAVTLSRANYCVPTEIALWLLCQPKKHTYTHTHTHTHTQTHTFIHLARSLAQKTRGPTLSFLYSSGISVEGHYSCSCHLQHLITTLGAKHKHTHTDLHTHRNITISHSLKQTWDREQSLFHLATSWVCLRPSVSAAHTNISCPGGTTHLVAVIFRKN